MILNNVDSILSSFVSFQYSYLLFFFLKDHLCHTETSIFICPLLLYPISFGVYLGKVKVKSLSHVWLFVTLWTVAYQVPPSMGFLRQEHLSPLSVPSPGDLPTQGSNPGLPHRRQEALLSEPPGESSWTGSIAGQGIIYIHLFECLSFVWSFYLIFHSF